MTFDGRARSIRSRRKPGAPPAIAAQTKNALQAVDQLPEELREPMRAIIKPIADAAVAQDVFNKRTRASYDSFPGPHRDTHLPDSQLDPLLVGAPAGLGDANDEGDANTFARSDHVHKREVRIAKAGSVVGTRGRINLIAGDGVTITATDDPGSDEVDVTITAGSTPVAESERLDDYYLWQATAGQYAQRLWVYQNFNR